VVAAAACVGGRGRRRRRGCRLPGSAEHCTRSSYTPEVEGGEGPFGVSSEAGEGRRMGGEVGDRWSVCDVMLAWESTSN
jgi:hypothetical protein